MRAKSSNIHCNGPCTFISPPSLPLSDYTAPLNALSTQLSTLSATPGAGIVDNSGNATFTVPTGTTGIAVIDITGSQLETDLHNSNVEFSIPNTVTGLIVNVDGSFLNPGGVNFNGEQQDALFNFYGSSSTAVTLGPWGASILAPFAAVTINADINGFVYADSFTSNGCQQGNRRATNLSDDSIQKPAKAEMRISSRTGRSAGSDSASARASAPGRGLSRWTYPTGHRHLWTPAVAFAAPQALGGDGRCGLAVLDFSQNGVEVAIERPHGLISHDLAAIKGHGRYQFLRDMPPSPPTHPA